MKDASIRQAAELIRRSHSPVVFTGAGVSQESGVPTFRDALTGFWEQYDAQSLATPEAFVADPDLVWAFYEYRRGLIRKAKPNAAHIAIGSLEERVSNLVIVTQNVDGFHQAIGNREVIALHGNIFENRCFEGCGWMGIVDAKETDKAPLCPGCRKSRLRPNVVWFGENLEEDNIVRATAAVLACDVMVAVGTSGLVAPASQLPELAILRGKPVIEVNPKPTPFTPQATIALSGKAGDVLPKIFPPVW